MVNFDKIYIQLQSRGFVSLLKELIFTPRNDDSSSKTVRNQLRISLL